MADEFKTFDKVPIMERISSSKWLKFGLKEIVLIAIIASLLVLVLVFAGLFGKAETQLALGTTASASAIVGNTYCTDTGCLKAAARVLDYMNKSVDPCENFFEYACGNYKVAKRAQTDAESRSILNDMYRENEDKLIEVLEKPVSKMHDYASERKLKHFFQACNDMYNREKSKGTPFLNKVITALGGWKLLGTWDPNWSFDTALKKVDSEFWVDALYAPRVTRDIYSNNGRNMIIQIGPGGTGKYMRWDMYLNPNTEKIRQDYKKFMRRVGSLLIRDALDSPLKNTTLQDTYLDEFVNDSFNIEYKVAVIAANAIYRSSAYTERTKISLADLNTETGNLINWVDQVSSLFYRGGVTGSTKVVVLRMEYFKNMTTMIASLPESDRNRMLHNYLIWRVAEVYVQELSWEYIHANREIYEDIYNKQDFSGLYRYCFYGAKFYLSDALSALFINEHFVDESKQTVTDITDNMKLALQTQLEATPWLDKETKTYAKEKLDRVTFKMGHPDWMSNTAYVDQIYNSLTINDSDHFSNLLSANQLVRDDWNEMILAGAENREEWIFATFSTVVAVYWYWNEIIAPAGILQPPVYHKDQPHHITFGSLGSILGRFVHHIVDEWGMFFDKNGDYLYPNSWWSNSSLESYKDVKECVLDVYTNVSKDYLFPDGVTRPVRINAAYYTPIAISWTNGIRLALIGYKDWLKSQGIFEKLLPGVELTNEQMVYVSHAQTFCYARDKKTSYLFGGRGRVEEDVQVNMALGQLQEFSDAFRCKPESKMNHAKKCDYY